VEIRERIDVAASPEAAWAVISDPRAVVGCVPGASIDGPANADGTYDLTVSVAFGPARMAFRGKLAIQLEPATRSGHLTGLGREGVGGTRVAATATFRVEAGPSGSLVSVTGEVEISGRLAPLIEGGAGIVIRRTSAEFAQRLADRCAAAS
jgi:carbon monoxide dehydrogenase subunit G